MDHAPTLRERKRARTRAAIVRAAVELFEARGYDATTVADVAAAAEIGTRTYFGYFATKEAVLFPELDDRVRAVDEALAARAPEDRPTDVLLRALARADPGGAGVEARRARLCHRLVREVPAVRGRALQLQADAQRVIADRLRTAFPGELDAVAAGALVGAFVGAVTGAGQALADTDPAAGPDAAPAADPDAGTGPADRDALHTAVRRALTTWSDVRA